MAITPPPFNVNSTDWTDYTPRVLCKRIAVREVLAAGTANYLVRINQPSGSTSYKSMLAGEEFVFSPGYWLGPDSGAVFSLKMASAASVNFDGTEQ